MSHEQRVLPVIHRADEDARRLLAAIVESSDDAIISKDLNGVIKSWNTAAMRIFGFTPEEAIGRRILILIPPELHAEEDAILAQLRAGKRIDHYETERLTKDGRRLRVSVTISPVRDSTGRIIGASKIARDITERKRVEQVLLTSEKLASVGRLAATVAHEINNPLESVINLVYLAKAASNHDVVQRYLGAAEDELSRIAHLTKQTLGFYRESSERTRAHAGDLLRQLAGVLSARAHNKGVRIKIEIINDPEIAIDRNEFRQLFSNLINNSIDACGRGGAIRVRVSVGGRSPEWAHALQITVADNGSGIKPADRTHIFEPFFTTKKDIGTGLGLWVCKQIAEKYGGTVLVRSAAKPGRSWTAVSVSLPVIVSEPHSAYPPLLEKGA
jgi:PAS domain S-box-containing protein